VTHRDRSRTDGARRDDESRYEKKTPERGNKLKDEAEVVDDDERDRLKVAEIVRRMEKRKAAKELEISRTSWNETRGADTVADVPHVKKKRVSSDVTKPADKSVADSQRGTKKVNAACTTTTVAHATQREAARQWAAEETSDASTVTQSTGDKGSTRLRATNKAEEAKQTVSTETLESLEIQKFIASQYPPVDEGVSSTVRLGRSLVSGAMGRRTDDPRIFETPVDLIECSVVLRTTKEKAKTPVSNPPPNSIESDVEGDGSGDVHLSQSTTDTGVCIELPGGGPEIAILGKSGLASDEARTDIGSLSDEPETPGDVVTPVIMGIDNERGSTARPGKELTGTGKDGRAELRTDVTPRSVVLSEFNRMMNEIDASALMQEKLRKIDPTLASASSFLSVVTGGAGRKKNAQAVKVAAVAAEVVRKKAKGAGLVTDEVENVRAVVTGVETASTTLPGQQQPTARYIEKQRTTRIVAAESLLREELKKANSSLASVTTFRKAAYGDESMGKTELGAEQ